MRPFPHRHFCIIAFHASRNSVSKDYQIMRPHAFCLSRQFSHYPTITCTRRVKPFLANCHIAHCKKEKRPATNLLKNLVADRCIARYRLNAGVFFVIS